MVFLLLYIYFNSNYVLVTTLENSYSKKQITYVYRSWKLPALNNMINHLLTPLIFQMHLLFPCE